MGEKETVAAVAGSTEEAAQRGNLNSSKSNIYRSGGGLADPEDGELEDGADQRGNLNSSRSNVYRSAPPKEPPERRAVADGPRPGDNEGERAMASICACGWCMQDAYGRCNGCDSTDCTSAEACGCSGRTAQAGAGLTPR